MTKFLTLKNYKMHKCDIALYYTTLTGKIFPQTCALTTTTTVKKRALASRALSGKFLITFPVASRPHLPTPGTFLPQLFPADRGQVPQCRTVLRPFEFAGRLLMCNWNNFLASEKCFNRPTLQPHPPRLAKEVLAWCLLSWWVVVVGDTRPTMLLRGKMIDNFISTGRAPGKLGYTIERRLFTGFFLLWVAVLGTSTKFWKY